MNILHLSDIHFGRNYPCYGLKDNFAKHDQILDELIETVANIDESLRPEHIVFTGDIVWHGKSREYQEALSWFRRLLDALHLTGKDISFCVGNHDIDLSCICNDPNIDNNSVKEIDEYYKYENIHKLEFPLYGYNEFCRELGVVPYSYPLNGKRKYSYSVGYKDILFSNGKTLRLLALNTSMLMPFDGISEDKMWLGQEQIKTLINYNIIPASEDIWYTITLCHHSDRFLHPDETSTYNGRPATLSLLLENVNLMLCGHTESSGKPRLSKQQGGGSILCGGASYYSDDHINAFSMIYLSEKKRAMGFLPYVYENGWNDYNFEQHFISAYKDKNLLQETEIIENVRIVFEADSETFEIKCNYLHFINDKANGCDHLCFDNQKDLMNTFSISYDSDVSKSDPVHVGLSSLCKSSASSCLKYKEFADFEKKSGNASNRKCSVITENGNEIFSTESFVADTPCFHDVAFLNIIRQIEERFDVRFKLPDTISLDELKKLDFLHTVSESNQIDSGTNNLAFSEKGNQFQLFGVTLNVDAN